MLKKVENNMRPVQRWSPAVTVSAVIEQEKRFLLVQEQTTAGLQLNNPAGHLEPCESLIEACKREVLEETAFDFIPTALVGIYLSQLLVNGQEKTFLRFAFCGQLQQERANFKLDKGIVAKLWLTKQQIQDRISEHRTPMLLQNINDYLAGQRFSLDLLYHHHSIYTLTSK